MFVLHVEELLVEYRGRMDAREVEEDAGAALLLPRGFIRLHVIGELVVGVVEVEGAVARCFVSYNVPVESLSYIDGTIIWP